ncbi:unnamed protein product, partial [Trichogramma brassicae]
MFRCNLEKIRRKRDSQNVTHNRLDEVMPHTGKNTNNALARTAKTSRLLSFQLAPSIMLEIDASLRLFVFMFFARISFLFANVWRRSSFCNKSCIYSSFWLVTRARRRARHLSSSPPKVPIRQTAREYRDRSEFERFLKNSRGNYRKTFPSVVNAIFEISRTIDWMSDTISTRMEPRMLRLEYFGSEFERFLKNSRGNYRKTFRSILYLFLLSAHGKSVNLTTFRCNLEKIRRKRDSQNVTHNRLDDAHGKSVNLTTFRCNLEKIRRKRDFRNVTHNRLDDAHGKSVNLTTFRCNLEKIYVVNAIFEMSHTIDWMSDTISMSMEP